jgi:hypothetical protein
MAEITNTNEATGPGGVDDIKFRLSNRAITAAAQCLLPASGIAGALYFRLRLAP